MDNYYDPYEKSDNDRRPEPADLECAGFTPRLIASLIDGLILGFVNSIILTAVFYTIMISVSSSIASEGGSSGLGPMFFFIFCGFFAVVIIVQWLYYALFECSPYMATPGKIVLGLKVTNEYGETISFFQATKRYVAKMLTNLVLCIGYLSIIFSENKQSIYDKIAGTYVVKN